MANLYLTHKCKRGCPFCFARDVLKDSNNVDEILTLDDIELLLNHFKGQYSNIGLLGGEPLLYPYLMDTIKLLHKHHIYVKIFTSATIECPKELEQYYLENGHINFIVNVGDRNSYNDIQFKNLETFFKKFHSTSVLSYTIFDITKDISTSLFDMIQKYNLVKQIRTGIALPIYNGGNKYIPLNDYRKIGDFFCSYSDEAAKRGIVINMDCGFVACMFTDKQLGHIIMNGVKTNFSCGPVTDIGPGLKTWHCFPLFQKGRINALEAKNARELEQSLREQLTVEGELNGIYQECSTCKQFIMNVCKGGCKSFNFKSNT